MTNGEVGSTSPMWIAHHDCAQYDRCVRIGSTHACRRCLTLYPIAVAVAIVQVMGDVPTSIGLLALWVAPIGVVVEWVLEQFDAISYSARRQVVLSAIAALGLGVALGRHARHPFDLQATASTIGFAAICFATWVGGHARRRRTAGRLGDVAWAEAFEVSELRREQRLRELIDLDLDLDRDLDLERDSDYESKAVTKSMSSSTAPTSDGSRSL